MGYFTLLHSHSVRLIFKRERCIILMKVLNLFKGLTFATHLTFHVALVVQLPKSPRRERLIFTQFSEISKHFPWILSTSWIKNTFQIKIALFTISKDTAAVYRPNLPFWSRGINSRPTRTVVWWWWWWTAANIPQTSRKSIVCIQVNNLKAYRGNK